MDILVKNKIIVLDDNKEFLILDTIDSEKALYLFLINVYDDNEVMIRKYDKDLDLIIGLDTEEEVQLLITRFVEKNVN